MDIFVVLCDGEVSSECYTTRKKAVDFIKGRVGYPKQIRYGEYKDSFGDRYVIKVLNCK